jgi:GNAT superfamily N-acetyltransferase
VPPDDPVLVEVAPGPDRERWVPLLALADEPTPLRAYLQQGELFGLTRADGTPLAAVLVIGSELRAVAVAEASQGEGIGTRLVMRILGRLAERGVGTATVGTASSGVRQLGFYQRCGFRLSHVERDFFTEEKGYPPGISENGIATRDIVWLDRDLGDLLRV